jgi:hypothetical protein
MSFIYTVNGNYIKNDNPDCSDGKCLIFPNMINNKPTPQKKVTFAENIKCNKKSENCEGKCSLCKPTTKCQNISNMCKCMPFYNK